VILRDSVARKNKRRVERASAARGQGSEQLAELQIKRPLLASKAMECQTVVLGRPHFGRKRDLKLLKWRPVKQVRSQAKLRELTGDIVRSLIQPRGANPAAFQRVGRQIRHGLSKPRLRLTRRVGRDGPSAGEGEKQCSD